MQVKEHGKRYIMLLEDDEDLAQGIELSLRSDDVELVSCRSIAQAEEQMKKRTFDLLILDINLPDGSGLAFCRSVRASSRVPIAMPVSYTHLWRLPSFGISSTTAVGFRYSRLP